MQKLSKLLASRIRGAQQVQDIDKSKLPNEVDVGEPASRVPSDQKEIKHGLYVYCIVPSDSPREYGRIGVGNDSSVYAIPFKGLAAIVSDFEGDSFDKTDANILAHQRVVQKIFEKVPGIPVKFGTIREDEGDIRNVLEEGYSDFEKELSELMPREGRGSALEFASPTDVIGQFTREQEKIREVLGDLRNLYTDNAASIGFQLGSLASSFEKLKTLFTEGTASLEKTVKETIVEAIPPSIEQTLTKQATAVHPDMALLEKIVRETIVEAIPPSIEKALAKQATAVQPDARTRPPAREAIAPEYTWCVSCRTAIGLADRFCDHCGWPTALTQRRAVT